MCDEGGDGLLCGLNHFGSGDVVIASADSVQGGQKRLRAAGLRRWWRRGLWLVVIGFVVWQGLGFYIAYDYLSRNHHDLRPVETPADRGLVAMEVTIPVPPNAENANLGQAGAERSGEGAGMEPARVTGGVAGAAEESTREVRVSADRLRLSGWFLPADVNAESYQGGAVVIMLHGFGSSKAKIWEDEAIGYRGSIFDQGAESLVRGGFHVLLFDFRNHGDSGDRGTVTLGYREAEDVVAAVRFVREELPSLQPDVDPDRIGLRGSSMGGATALLAAAGRVGDDVGAIWVDSAFATAEEAVEDFLAHHGVPGVVMPPVKFWLQQLSGMRFEDVRPVAQLGQISCPLVITHSVDDTMIRKRHFERFVLASQNLPQVDTWEVSGVQHNRLWTVAGYLDRQRDFFQRHLGKPVAAAAEVSDE